MVRYRPSIYHLLVTGAVGLLFFILACGSAAPQEIIREVEVEKEVIKEVQVEVPVEKEVIREVEVEKTVVEERIQQVEVEKIVEVDKILVATPTPAPAPAAATVSQGHLRITYTSLGSDGIYPKAGNVNAGGKDVNSTMYDVVIGSNGQGAFSKDTGLAHDWEMSPDGKTHTIYMRQGIKFHNGEEVTAHDAKFGLEEAMEDDSQPRLTGS